MIAQRRSRTNIGKTDQGQISNNPAYRNTFQILEVDEELNQEEIPQFRNQKDTVRKESIKAVNRKSRPHNKNIPSTNIQDSETPHGRERPPISGSKNIINKETFQRNTENIVDLTSQHNAHTEMKN